MKPRAATAPRRKQPRAEAVTVTYAAEDDPATADRVVALFRRLLAQAQARRLSPRGRAR